MMIRRYSELASLGTFEERFEYLRLRGQVGDPTFGYDRWMNQDFYASTQWRQIRHHVIARDQGCDLGVEGFEVFDRIYIHHMNPMSVQDLQDGNEDVLDPEFLISCTHRTHNAIHYGNGRHLPRQLVTRRAGDTKLW
ncbi:MAG TPA: hypothetical protein PKD16_02010 [Saprospiraceae bacterium]|jgi:hypothetical protein|nr:hypothetical protein [Saprospiraceae bacterium]